MNLQDVPCPLKLKCTVTGKEVTYTAREYILGRIEKAGSLDLLIANYVSKGAHKDAKGASKPTPPTTKTWKGEAVIKPTAPVVVQAEPSGPVDIVHREYTFKDGCSCNVYHPRQNPDQPASSKYEFK